MKCSHCEQEKTRGELIPEYIIEERLLLCGECHQEFADIHNEYEIKKKEALARWNQRK